MLRGALSCAARGVSVFACEPSGKRPLTKSGHWDATTDEGLLRRWWRRWPSANLAAPMGKGSGLLVLDVDPDRGGEAALAQFERSCGPAPRTARARIGGGGLHLYLRYPSEAKVAVRNSAGYLGLGLDVRGEGGYVIVPPSQTVGLYSGWTGRLPPGRPGFSGAWRSWRSGRSGRRCSEGARQPVGAGPEQGDI
jgi:hypothetical protein